MDKLQPRKVKQFQQEILLWFSKNNRDLPWRQTRDPYKILVSEVMLQQTQVSRVIPKYQEWLAAFPTIEDLAKAKTSEVLRLWSGLGYNRRALYLQKTAKIIVEKYTGVFPQDEKGLLSLPGIGEYTARAVLCFARNKQVAVVDTNVRKVIIHVMLNSFQHQNPQERRSRNKFGMTTKEIQEIANQLLPHARAYEWNQALMDYAAMVLKKEKISIPKQSRFIGSDRYYRGKIIKLLLEIKTVDVKKLGKLLKDDFLEQDKDWLEEIIKKLVRDGLMKRKNNIVSLA